MSSDTLSTLQEVVNFVPKPDESPICIVMSPRMYRTVHRATLKEKAQQTNVEGDPTALDEMRVWGVAMHEDKALRPGHTPVKGIAVVFYDREEISKYANLPDHQRITYAFKEEGDPVSIAFSSSKLPFPPAGPTKGKSKTLIWVEDDEDS